MLNQIVVSQENESIGTVLWEFAKARGDAVYLYAPQSLGDRKLEPISGWSPVEEYSSYIRSFVEPYGSVSLGRFGHADYGLYAPNSREDLKRLCVVAHGHGGCIEVAVPLKLELGRWDALSPLWRTFRPLRHLARTDICHELSVPWVYVISAYNYDPCLAIACFESDQLGAKFAELVSGCGAHLWPLPEAIQGEQQVWEQNYSGFDEATQQALPDEEGERRFQQFKDEFNRRFPS